MSDESEHRLCSTREQVLSGECERPARVGHVVDEDGSFAFDVTDEDHASNFVGLFTLLVEEGEIEVEGGGHGGGAVFFQIHHPVSKLGEGRRKEQGERRRRRRRKRKEEEEEEEDEPLGSTSVRGDDDGVVNFFAHRFAEVLEHGGFGVELFFVSEEGRC